jgi:hypothetical protein
MFAVEDTYSLNLNASDRELKCINPNPPGNLEQDTLYAGNWIWPQFLGLHQGKNCLFRIQNMEGELCKLRKKCR